MCPFYEMLLKNLIAVFEEIFKEIFIDNHYIYQYKIVKAKWIYTKI